ncbi:hypothetical protein OIU77_020823 [Salix suchowensis]|uniref:F-box/LRR-repeat protein 10 n=1 Tax=Salix suchowensis TaxID=1278906 RepID=A0ABQ9C7Q0_9ROSI|nr:hypothetical protein OIU77_020823 [Salix suchowensis]
MASPEEEEEESLDQLPGTVLGTIISKLDVASICSVASTCKTFNACASHILTFIPSFHLLDIAPSIDLLRPLLPPNPYLKSLKLDCARLDDSAINGSVAEKRGRAIHISDLEVLLRGCTQLEELILMFDVPLFLRHNFAQVWALASEKLTSLEIGCVSSVMVTELLIPSLGHHRSPDHFRPPILPGIQKLCLSVDYITDTMVSAISSVLVSLTHLDLRDAPLIEPISAYDLTNSGLQQINQHGKLKHLSLVRSQEFLFTYFRRVNDLGMLFMADNCANMESICLGGFCRVTDAGFKTILHSCSSLYKLRVSYGTHLSDLNLVSNTHLKVLDLRDCKHLGDVALRSISTLPELKILLLDGSNISDFGLSYLRGVINSLVSLSVRGCKRLTDKCISALFEGSSKLELQQLDLSNLPNLSDNGVLTLAKCRVPISELRMRQCPLIGDTSVMALASMQVDEDRWHGCRLRLLDLYNCGGITQLSFWWLKKPYFPRLRWLGVTGSVSRDIVDALSRNRPFLHVACQAEELGSNQWDNSFGLYTHDYDEVDELEQLLEEGEYIDEEMEVDNNAELMEYLPL